ncbi:hypothetical protein BUALT_Bualt16G0048900 [Buddleja alternifolia]|uniref:J domain-containing protein n=1 Tax=Buddleja alternifolia TaxID=168488 RepID=A0AAV6WJR9_9LAMI|nr:hypothetical protein BUALT_Bualt16G0048900 [Buddleja alternifolia]
MECNKDEAIRAKQIAEKKMENNDFEGARKIALKAQKLYPNLENITQLLSICDVQCSAQKRMSGEKGWYEILQLERLADELTIKKQYRRLALHLHPDKNRFPGAEAAFKLICEANAALSDPAKKSLYDSKIRADKSASVNPPSHRNAQFNKQYGAQNDVSNGFSSVNQCQATQSSSSFRQEVFWTSCPFCSVKYQYHRKVVNTTLRCQKCSKNFIGYEISGQGVPAGSKCVPPSARHVPSKPSVSQSAPFQEKGTDQGKFTTGVQNNEGSSASQAGPQQRASRKPVRPEPGARTESDTKVGGDLNSKETNSRDINSSRGVRKSVTSNGDAINRETGDLKKKTKKRGKKVVVESSESRDVSSESKLEDVTTEDPANDLNPAHSQQRSSRKRQHVSYNEGCDNLPSPLKRSQAHKLSQNNGNEQKNALTGEGSKHDNRNSFPSEADYSKSETKEMGTFGKEVKSRGEAGSKSDAGADTIETKSDPDCGSHSSDNADKGISACDDPEFNDFDKARDESCFAVNQLWACYDDDDGMPRFYAKVTRVHTSPFELSIKWLEADPIGEALAKWVEEELPAGCGSFKLGETVKTSRRLSFSHQMHCLKGKKRGSLIMYPRKREVWALFKDWDISWSSEPENHKEFKYEVVEVLADFDAVAGIKVSHLEKVSGFVSLFQRSSQRETDSFLIGPNELYKFSHLVPSYKMRGTEREGVPANSFELDPASLPQNPNDLYYPGKAKMESGNLGPKINCAPKKGNFVKSESISTSTKIVDSDRIDGEIFKPRRSPRGLKCNVK